MTVELRGATCPRCGTEKSVKAIYIRSDDGSDLVCHSCREGVTPQAPTERLPSSRQLFRRR